LIERFAAETAGVLLLETEVKTLKSIWNTMQAAFTVIGGYLGWFLGGFDGFLYALIVFVWIDYLTGLMCAVIDKRLSSEIGAKGIFKKVLIFALVGLGHMLDTQVLGDGSAIRNAVIFFYLSNEGISILENATHIGLPLPRKLKAVLKQLNEEEMQ